MTIAQLEYALLAFVIFCLVMATFINGHAAWLYAAVVSFITLAAVVVTQAP